MPSSQSSSSVDASLARETVWLDKHKYDEAERQYHEHEQQKQQGRAGAAGNGASSSHLVYEISRAKQHIKNSLHCAAPTGGTKAGAGAGQTPAELNLKIAELEAETDRLNKVTDDLRALVLKLETRVSSLEKSPSTSSTEVRKAPAATVTATTSKKEEPKKDDDDVDLFGSDEDDDKDEEKDRLRQERLQAYEAKKSKKPALIAKSNIILDIKPWDDETDMKEMEKQVRTIVMDGLLWGASKLVALAYGIHKLQISCVVEDDKVSVDILTEQIEAFDQLVQSVDIAAFNKV